MVWQRFMVLLVTLTCQCPDSFWLDDYRALRSHAGLPHFDYWCEYCKGTVRTKHVAREAFKHKTGFVILENVTIGVCDTCGNRSYLAETVKRAQRLLQRDPSGAY